MVLALSDPGTSDSFRACGQATSNGSLSAPSCKAGDRAFRHIAADYREFHLDEPGNPAAKGFEPTTITEQTLSRRCADLEARLIRRLKARTSVVT